MQFREHRLENGLEIVAEVNPRAYSTALAFFVNAGSRDESEELWGVSHFLEHMAFKGTAKRTAEDVNRELDEMGSDCNARTSEEQTIYHAVVLPEFQDRAGELLCDLMRPMLREQDFETEKQVIIEEIRMYDDQPPYGLHDKAMAAHFAGHPLARGVLGTVESVSALTADRMRDYFRSRYSPSNIALVAAGNVDFERLVKVAEESCGGWPAFDAPREMPAGPAAQGFHTLVREGAVQEYTIQIAGGPSAEDELRFASRLLATIMGDDSGSRYYWELMETGKAEYAVMGAYEYQGAGLLMTFHCSAPEQVEPNLARILELQQELEAGGVTEEELARAKSKVCSHVILQSERPANRLFAVGVNWLQRREYRTTRDAVREYQAVTREQVNAVLEKFPLTTNTTMSIGPLLEIAAPVAVV